MFTVNNFTKIILLPFIILFFVSCQTNTKQKNSQIEIYNKTLVSYYNKFADESFNKDDWFNSYYFKLKADSILSGVKVKAEEINKWDVSKSDIPQITQARVLLLAILTKQVKENYPVESAQALFAFDCWIKQLEEKSNSKMLDKCRTNFYQNLDKLYSNKDSKILVTDKNYNNSPLDTEKASPIKQNRKSITYAYFDSNSYLLNNNTHKLINKIAGSVKDTNYSITINGYSDKTGSNEYNMLLSMKRSLEIKNSLVDKGLNHNKITAYAFGETQQFITKLPDNIKNHRFVEIIIEN